MAQRTLPFFHLLMATDALSLSLSNIPAIKTAVLPLNILLDSQASQALATFVALLAPPALLNAIIVALPA